MKKYILIISLFLLSMVSYSQTTRVLSGFEPTTGRPGYKYYDTAISLPNTTLKYLTGYGTFGSFYDTARAAFSGTANRITLTSGVIDISGSYVGQSSITTLGTVTTGTWNGTAIGAIYGGTGQTTVTTGDLLYGSAANTWSKLAAGTSTHVLTSNGAGVAPSWQAAGGGSGWSLTGNSIDSATNFLGTTNAHALKIRVNNILSGSISSVGNSTSYGYEALKINTGAANTAFGYGALKVNVTGTSNVAIGFNTLPSNTGTGNLAIGTNAMTGNTSGGNNVAIGLNALVGNLTSNNNVAVGTSALAANTATGNTAVGYTALGANIGGTNNTGIGNFSLTANTSGVGNTGLGENSLRFNATTSYNSGVGYQALYNNTGTGNSSVGFNNYFTKTTGDYNSSIGYRTGFTQSSGGYNVAIGASVDLPSLTGSGQLNIGNVIYGVNLYQSTTSSSTPTTTGRIGIGVTTPTAFLHLQAPTTAASTGQIKLAEGSRQTAAENGTINYVADNLEFVETSTVYTLAKTLTATATLDFGSTLAGAVTDLTMTVTGAVDGDAVSIGVPNASYPATGTFTAWISAANTVTIRYANNSLTLAQDPASGTYRASVVKY